VLHTWGQNLHHHPHIHCVVPAGGPSLDHTRWVTCRRGSSCRCASSSRLFRRLFLDELRTAFTAGELGFFGELAVLAEPAAFARHLRELRRVEWVVYAKPPFGGPAQVLAYLGDTHTASPSPTPPGQPGQCRVAFRWKDYRHHGKTKLMTLAADEFIRRFLLHTLPDGFHRIRHYGFLANRQARRQACALSPAARRPSPEPPAEQVQDAVPSHRPDRCPTCVAPWSCSVSWRARRPVAHPSGMTPRDAPAIPQHRSSDTGRRLRPRGPFRSPSKPRSGSSPVGRKHWHYLRSANLPPAITLAARRQASEIITRLRRWRPRTSRHRHNPP